MMRQPGKHSRSSASLQAEQVRVLYSSLPFSIPVNGLLAAMVAYTQHTQVPLIWLACWFATLSAVLSLRAALYLAFNRSNPKSINNANFWLFWARLTVFFTGLVWGGSSILFAYHGDTAFQVIGSFAIAGLCAGAITSLSIDRVSTYCFLLPVLIPQCISFFLEGSALTNTMGLMVLLFLFYTSSIARQSSDISHQNFYLRSKAVEDEALIRFVLESSPVATRIVSAETGKVIFANPSYLELMEIDKEKLEEFNVNDVITDVGPYSVIVDQLEQGNRIFNKLIKIQLPEKQKCKWVLATYIPLEYQGEPTILGWLFDITDRKQMEEKIQYLAHHDPLTQLPNRTLLNDRLKQALARAKRYDSSLSLMFVDLDNFKPVNDNYGHEVGDDLLKEAAKRIVDSVRQSDTVARIGGDEFIVILTEVISKDSVLEVAEKIRDEIGRLFQISEFKLSVSSSIGIAIFPESASEQQQLIHHADVAMYHAKNGGKNCVRIYEEGMKNIDK